MAYTDIDKPSDYFNTSAVWSGDDSEHTISGIGHQPNFTWIKGVNIGTQHYLFDSVRGATKVIISNGTNAEFTVAQTLKSWNSDGFVLGTSDDVNGGSRTYVAWNWKAGTSFTNDASGTGIGSIDSTGSVNTDAGFSICSFTGTGGNGTVKHGLSTVPKMIIFKNRPQAEGWIVYHQAISNTHFLTLNTTGAKVDNATMFNDTSPTSSVFSVGSNHGTNGPSHAMIAYCFADVKGYSKFSSYTGNGNADGTFVYTGFKPAFIMIKETGNTSNWTMYDTKRIGFNQLNYVLVANSAAAEWDANADHYIDILSNGVKFRGTSPHLNRSGGSYIYMAFAENPFVTGSSGIPTTAR
jgi:hypothetical protein